MTAVQVGRPVSRAHQLVPVCGRCGRADGTVARTSLPGGVHAGEICRSCYSADPSVRAQRRTDLVTLAEMLYAGDVEYPTVHELLGRWRIPSVRRLELWLEVEAAVDHRRRCHTGDISPADHNMPSWDALYADAEVGIDQAVSDLLDGAQ